VNQDRYLERMPPQDQDAERSLLGSVMWDNRTFDRVAAKISPEHFYFKAHRVIWEACTRLYEANEPMDQITVVDELRKKAQLDEAGGVVFLADLAALTATGANIRTYADILIEMHHRRKLIELSSVMCDRAYDERYAPLATQGGVERALEQISQKEDGDPVTLGDSLSGVLRVYDERKAAGRDVIGYRTGFPTLDRLTLGLIPSEYSLLAARPSEGKSALALQLARQVVELNDDVEVVIFSLEMPDQVVTQRLLSNKARIPFGLLRVGRLTEGDETRLSNASSDLAKAPIYLDCSPTLHVIELRGKVRRLKRKAPALGLVIVDYLQLLTGDTTESRNQEVGSISRHLKALATELKVAVLAVSQLSRPVGGSKDRPTLSSLRDSGSLEQDADNVFFLYNPGRNGAKVNGAPAPDNEIDFIIAKARNGPIETVTLNWQKDSMTFAEQSDRYDDEYIPYDARNA